MANPKSDNLPSNLSYLHRLLVEYFSLEELRTLCLELGIRYDDLGGEGISAKARELLLLLLRADRIEALLIRGEQLRPTVDWRFGLPAEPEAQSPYKGLQVFREEDAAIFFGRDQLSAVLLDHLRQHRFLAVVGASGSGKSSVVQAGVLTAVRRGEIVIDGSSSAGWPIHLITPGDEPLKALAVAFTRDSESVTATKTLLADLQADGDSLDLYLYRYRQVSDKPYRRVLLLVDQFEELFTQCDDPAERQMFVDNLVKAVTSGQQGRLSLILTLRADFYAFAVQFESLRPLLETRQKIVGAMSQDELRQAIEGPAEQGGWQLQPGLVETMLQDVGREPGALPLLSHALQETWERRERRELTLAGYQAAGGVRQAIATTANAVYTSLNETQQAIARNIFLRLTELGEGTEDTRRRAPLPELLPQGEDTAAVQDVLDLLARKRLVTLNEERAAGEAAQNYAEVAHEALIREWPELRAWLAENREGLRTQRQITAAAQEWQTAGEDPGYLYRGGRLTQSLEWAAEHGPQLNELERRFLAASRGAAEREEQEREAQRQRELEAAQQLAEEQKKARNRLRQIIGGLVVGLVIVGLLAFLLYGSNQTAQDNAATAEAARQSSDANAALAQTREADAITQAAAVATAQAREAERAAEAINAQATAEMARVEAETAQTRAEQQAHLAQVQSLAALSQVVYQDSYDSEIATLLAIEAYRRMQPDDGGVAWLIDSSLRTLLAFPYFNNVLRGHENSVESVAFSPDGQTLASGSRDSTIRLWDLSQPTAEPTVLRGHTDTVWSVAFSPDGRTLASASGDNTVRLWDLSQSAIEPTVLWHDYMVYSVIFSPNGQTLVSGSFDNTIRFWDLSQLAAGPVVLLGHEDRVTSVAFSPDGRTLASGSYDDTIRLWNLSRPAAEPIILHGHEDPVWSVAFSSDGQTLASGSDDGTIRLWDLVQLDTQPTILRGHDSRVTSVAFSPDGRTVASGSYDDSIRLWDLSQPSAQPAVLRGHTDTVWSVAFSPDGRTLASGSYDDTIRLWDLSQPSAQPAVLRGHKDEVWSVAFSPDGRTLASGSYDTTIRLWDLNQLDADPTMLIGHYGPVISVAFSPDGWTLASSSGDGTIRLWDLSRSAAEPTVLRSPGYEDPMSSVVFSPDGRTLASGGFDTTIRLWNLSRLDADPTMLIGHYGPVNSLVFSPDGQTLASGSDDTTIRLWDLSQPAAEPVILRGHEDTVQSVAFSPDGRILASGSDDATVRLWDLSQPTSEPIVLPGTRSFVYSVAFSPDGRTLASGGFDNIVRLWDLSHPAAEQLARGHEARVTSVAFSPDGRTLASASYDTTIRLWPLLNELVEIGCRKTHRNLSWSEWQRYLPGEPYRQTCPNWPVYPDVPSEAKPD